MNHRTDNQDAHATTSPVTGTVAGDQHLTDGSEMTDLPFSLRTALRAMRTDQPPDHDLWPSIAGQIHAPSRQSTHGTHQQPVPRRRPGGSTSPQERWRGAAALALAASLVLVVGVVWQKRIEAPDGPSSPSDGLLARAASGMTVEYQSAWQVLDAQRPDSVDATALHEIDRSAAQVRQALRRDPDARYLFDRLQSLYTRRLDLSQRIASQHATPI